MVAPGEAEVTLLCQAIGVPQPSITWAKNGIQLPPSYKYDHRPDGSLTIRDIDPSDHGNYQCEAVNANGRVTANANVIIKGIGKSKTSNSIFLNYIFSCTNIYDPTRKRCYANRRCYQVGMCSVWNPSASNHLVQKRRRRSSRP